MAKRSNYQQKAIHNYYQNRDAIALQRLQELVTELYLTEGKKRAQHWKSVASHLLAVGMKQEQVDHLVSQDNPELVANHIKDLLKRQ